MKKGDVQTAIEHAQLVIGSDCTTGLEAVLLGKQYINFIPHPEKGENNIGLSEIGALAHRTEDVVSLISQILDGKSIEASSLEVFDDTIYNVNNTDSALIAIADDITAYLEGVEPVNSLFDNLLSFFTVETAKHFVKYALSLFRAPINDGSKFIWPTKGEIYSIWSDMGGESSDLEFGHNYFCVRSNGTVSRQFETSSSTKASV